LTDTTAPGPEQDPRDELAALSTALRAHLELAGLSGAVGLPAASRELAEARATVSAASPVAPVDARMPGVEAASARETAPATPSAPPAPPALRIVGQDATARLRVLATEVATCTRCRLHETRTQTVFSRGNGSSGLCFVGEGPGAEEDAQGEPFVGAAGQLLDRMIIAMGLTRDEVYVCNIVKCRPPKNRKPETDEMTSCRPYVEEQIALLEPKVIVALGATAVQGLLGVGGGITRLRGTWRLYKGEVAVMPTFHPAYLLRTPEAKREVWQDLQEVLRHMGRTVPARK
jgi:DNA polymerase